MDEPRDVGLIIAAAGSGVRMGTDLRKPFLTIGKEPMLHLTCRRFSPLSEIIQRVILVHPDDLQTTGANTGDLLLLVHPGLIQGGWRSTHAVVGGEGVKPGVMQVSQELMESSGLEGVERLKVNLLL